MSLDVLILEFALDLHPNKLLDWKVPVAGATFQ